MRILETMAEKGPLVEIGGGVDEDEDGDGSNGVNAIFSHEKESGVNLNLAMVESESQREHECNKGEEAHEAKKEPCAEFKDYDVVKTMNGSAFHLVGCRYIGNSSVVEVRASEALDCGLHPCHTCFAK